MFVFMAAVQGPVQGRGKAGGSVNGNLMRAGLAMDGQAGKLGGGGMANCPFRNIQPSSKNQFKSLMKGYERADESRKAEIKKEIEEKLNEPDQEVRVGNIKELANTGNPVAWEFLKPLCNDESVSHVILWQSEKVIGEENFREIGEFQKNQLSLEPQEVRENFIRKKFESIGQGRNPELGIFKKALANADIFSDLPGSTGFSYGKTMVWETTQEAQSVNLPSSFTHQNIEIVQDNVEKKRMHDASKSIIEMKAGRMDEEMGREEIGKWQEGKITQDLKLKDERRKKDEGSIGRHANRIISLIRELFGKLNREEKGKDEGEEKEVKKEKSAEAVNLKRAREKEDDSGKVKNGSGKRKVGKRDNEKREKGKEKQHERKRQGKEEKENSEIFVMKKEKPSIGRMKKEIGSIWEVLGGEKKISKKGKAEIRSRINGIKKTLEKAKRGKERERLEREIEKLEKVLDKKQGIERENKKTKEKIYSFLESGGLSKKDAKRLISNILEEKPWPEIAKKISLKNRTELKKLLSAKEGRRKLVLLLLGVIGNSKKKEKKISKRDVEKLLDKLKQELDGLS